MSHDAARDTSKSKEGLQNNVLKRFCFWSCNHKFYHYDGHMTLASCHDSRRHVTLVPRDDSRRLVTLASCDAFRCHVMLVSCDMSVM